MNPRFRLFLILFVVLVAIDQMVKHWSVAQAQGVEGNVFLPLIPGIFEFKLAYNHGIGFGMFQGAGAFFAPVAILIAGFAAVWSFRNASASKLNHVTYSILAAGAIGNCIDRVVQQKVTDMFWIRAINFPVFNIADVCITIAAILMILGAIIAERNPAPESQTTEPA
jgi:signal peptidase II